MQAAFPAPPQAADSARVRIVDLGVENEAVCYARCRAACPARMSLTVSSFSPRRRGDTEPARVSFFNSPITRFPNYPILPILFRRPYGTRPHFRARYPALSCWANVSPRPGRWISFPLCTFVLPLLSFVVTLLFFNSPITRLPDYPILLLVLLISVAKSFISTDPQEGYAPH